MILHTSSKGNDGLHPTPCRSAAPHPEIGTGIGPNPAFKNAPILLDAKRRPLQRLVGPQGFYMQ